MQNANVYGKEVPRAGTSYAILECVGRALGQCAAASEAAAAALPPHKIGRREATEKSDLVCDRTPTGAYAVQKREGFFNTPGKQDGEAGSLTQEGDDGAPPPMLPPPVSGVDAVPESPPPAASPTPPDSPATPSAVRLRAERRRELRAERKAAAAAGTPLKAQPSPSSVAVAGRWPSAAAEDATAPAQVKVRVHCATLFARVAAAFGGGRYAQGEVARRLAGASACRSELPSPGKGGSKFFFAGDLVMKSVSEGEAATLKLLLPLYTAHVVANPGTLLPRFFAWVTVSYRSHLGGKTSIRLLVMENIVCSPHVVSTLYDIKGSTVNRDGSSVLPIAGVQHGSGGGGGSGSGTPYAEGTGTPEEHGVPKGGGVASRLFTTRSSVSSSGGGSEDGGGSVGLLASPSASAAGGGGGGVLRATVYKDKGLHGRVMSPADPKGILRRLEADVLFLRKQNIVDYSLLAGVRQRLPEEEEEGRLEEGDTGLCSTTRGEVYYLGVIDVLQPYTTAKKLETCFKGVVAREEDISIVAPPEYSLRFLGAACALLGCDISDSDAE